jgi:hypothetical protein
MKATEKPKRRSPSENKKMNKKPKKRVVLPPERA